MEGHQWESATTNEDDAQEGVCIKKDVPPVLTQESRVKFRSFCSVDDERWGNRADDSEFRIFKKRRFDPSLDYQKKNGCEEMQTEPLFRRLIDPFEVSQRQYQTLQWIRLRNPSVENIFARFALDRSLGAPPSPSSIHRLLQTLDQRALSSQRNENYVFIMRLLEDLILDGLENSAPWVVKILHGLLPQPVFAARVAFMLVNAMKEPLDTLPVTMWSELCMSLAQNSREYLSSCSECALNEFVHLFCKVVELVRLGGESIGEVTFAKFGFGMLLHRQQVPRVIGLVSQELFTGRNKTDAHQNPAVISAFLSRLICVSCDFELSIIAGYVSSCNRADGKFSSVVDGISFRSGSTFISFLGEVAHFAYKRNIQLSGQAFDYLLELCDAMEEYLPLCIFFSASCVLSLPTFRSFLRFVEVLHDFPHQLNHGGIRSVLNGSCSSFLLWFFKKYGEELCSHGHTSRARERALVHIFYLVGKIMCREGEASRVIELFSTLHLHLEISMAFLPVVSYYLLWRCRTPCTSKPFLEVSKLAAAFDAASEDAVGALLDSPLDVSYPEYPSERETVHLFTDRGEEEKQNNTSILLLRTALKEVISDPQMYCNILTTECINLLSDNQEYKAAFVRMMSDYRSRSGAVVIIPLDNVLPHASGLTEAGRKLAFKWYNEEHEWFIILSLSLSVQIGGRSPLCVSFDLFRTIQLDHKRVMLIGGSSEEVALAVEQNLQPVISVVDLMKKLLRK